MKSLRLLTGLVLVLSLTAQAQSPSGLLAEYLFDGSLSNHTGAPTPGLEASQARYIQDRHGEPRSALLARKSGFVGSGSVDYLKNRRSWTWTGWIRVDSLSYVDAAAIYSEGNNGISALIAEYRGHLFVGLWTEVIPSGWTPLTSPSFLVACSWTHVAVTLDTEPDSEWGLCTLYQDGEATITDAMPYIHISDARAKLHQFAFGMNVGYFIGGQSWAPYPFNGAIDNVRIFDHALTPDEIRALAGTPDSLQVNNAVELSFTPQSGQSYQLQSSDNLSAWNDWGSPITGSTNEFSTFVSTRSRNAGSFRLLPNTTTKLVVSPAVELTFGTSAGTTYQLQWSSNLSSWTPHGGPITGTGTEYSTIVSTRTLARRYWRLIVGN